MHVGIESGHCVGRGQRTEFRLFVEGIADPQVLHAFDKLALEFVGNRSRYDKALGCDARLSVIDDARLDGGGYGSV